MASRGINKVILIGHLGADPEVRYMPNGGAVTSLRIATSESWKDQQTGQTQERTEWHSAVIYRKLAEVAGKYLHKGSKIYVEGSLRTRKWQDKQTGQDRYTTEIIVNEMQMLDRANGQHGEDDESNRSTPGKPSASRYESSGKSAPAQDIYDDDVPF